MIKTTTNLDRACRVFGWGGGTIHEVARQVGMSGRGSELALMSPGDFERVLIAHFSSKGDQQCKRIG